MSDNDDDDYLLEPLTIHKRKDSGGKGKRGERELCKILKRRFPKHQFSRSVGSGNRYAQVHLSPEADRIMGSDIVCPPDFTFCIECKFGYPEINLINLVIGRTSLLDAFLNQVSRDAERIGKRPLLCWRKSRLPWFAFSKGLVAPAMIVYMEWSVVTLDWLLSADDAMFFA